MNVISKVQGGLLHIDRTSCSLVHYYFQVSNWTAKSSWRKRSIHTCKRNRLVLVVGRWWNKTLSLETTSMMNATTIVAGCSVSAHHAVEVL